MRISTNQIFDSGTLGIQRNQQGLFHLQNQLSSGRRVFTPEDDPVAAAQALIVTQSKDINTQYVENQGNASTQLGLAEANLASLTDLLQAVRERSIEAMGSLTDAQRGFIATDLQIKLESMVGLANTDDGAGQFMFSGYQGATRPFAIDGSVAPVAPATEPPVVYFGDNGERLLQVGASTRIAGNVSGAELFMDIRSGNGTFTTAVGGNTGGGINQGSAIVDAGSVTNPSAWASAVNTYSAASPDPKGFQVIFTSSTQYRIYDRDTPAVALTAAQPFVPGQAIVLDTTIGLAANFGAQVVVSGTPAAGDSFVVAPSTNQSVFTTLQNLIGALQTPVNATFTKTELTNRIKAEVTNLDGALSNLARVRAKVGSRMNELASLTSSAKDLDLQYSTALSGLQDLDYVEAISKFTQQQTQLEASQKSFAQISRLSLFDIL
ncbi:MAG: flagellar hook-associated protein FlgL [Betaproteobacteria bacterium]|nr:flagellar hook-associated protein FlgL [Betaproteobacteria bacterium]